jgi:hypothetical protein
MDVNNFLILRNLNLSIAKIPPFEKGGQKPP